MTKSLLMLMDGNFAKYDGEIYSPHMSYDSFGKRFAPFFSQVVIAGRAFEKNAPVGKQVCGNKVSFYQTSSNRGALSLLTSIPKLLARIFSLVGQYDVVLLRFPGNLAMIAMLCCLVRGKRFNIEIVAEPRDYFGVGASKHPLRLLARLVHVSMTKLAVKMADSVRYVTEEYLQQAYPAKDGQPSFGFTDVALPPRSYQVAHENRPAQQSIRLINVAMMHNHSKGHLNLFAALAKMQEDGLEFSCELVGDGALLPEFKQTAEDLGLSERVHFHGLVHPSEKVWDVLSQADLFVMTSFQEGMPRALLEASAIGLPCIASSVGGIPEVVAEQCLVDPSDQQDIYQKLKATVLRMQANELVGAGQQRKFEAQLLVEKYRDYCEFLVQQSV
ncbi:glycosyltransferase family 4 protein [Agarivorans aestuarii]|uniref:glycosyltransferase family 4 protein n=1 Tax=Agarivorans aestuarii TaxID=1563703 RepID=UPI001C815DB7|nr:glycosyltransferase family 4 protein [Agarivorans aestuarii]